MENKRIKENYLIDLKRHINFLKSEIESFEEEVYEIEFHGEEETPEYEQAQANITIYEAELEEKQALLERIYLEMEDEK